VNIDTEIEIDAGIIPDVVVVVIIFV